MGALTTQYGLNELRQHDRGVLLHRCLCAPCGKGGKVLPPVSCLLWADWSKFAAWVQTYMHWTCCVMYRVSSCRTPHSRRHRLPLSA